MARSPTWASATASWSSTPPTKAPNRARRRWKIGSGTVPPLALTRRSGITGHDGAYLAALLLAKRYEVHGIKRHTSSFSTDRVDRLYQDPQVSERRLLLHYSDLTDATNLIRILQLLQPDEIHNLGAQSHVQVSFETPEYKRIRMRSVRCGCSKSYAFSD